MGLEGASKRSIMYKLSTKKICCASMYTRHWNTYDCKQMFTRITLKFRIGKKIGKKIRNIEQILGRQLSLDQSAIKSIDNKILVYYDYEKWYFLWKTKKKMLCRITYWRWNEKLIKKKMNLHCYAKILSVLTLM